MKKLLLILVAAILVLILPAGVVAAKAEANRVEFNLVGTYDIGGEDLDASAVLTGNLRKKDGNLYLSPLKGTIMIGGEEYDISDISVKAKKQSAHLSQSESPDRVPPIRNQFDIDMQEIIVNIKGSKAASYSGTLTLGKESSDYGDNWEFFSELVLKVDRQDFCRIRGPHPNPTID